MWLRDAWMASRAAAMAARPGLSTAAPVVVQEDGRKGKRRKKKWGDVAPDRRVPLVSDARVRSSWRRIGGGLAGPRLGRKGKTDRLVGCSPRWGFKVFPLTPSYFYLIQI
jgi:hypothetical protein